ncbi:hypothetical protein BBJ28_00011467 [Nothophytophthora sp. Chile5]|nr:hypothetical protein BBJ28_00011467 [Nothophytophthora sp. Chile5]
MARQQRKKARSHVAAAHSTAQESSSKSNDAEELLGAAAVAATFGEDDAVATEDAEVADGEESLSRGQRKRLKRRSAFMRKMGLVSRVAEEKAAAAKKQEQGVFADLEELQQSLFDADADKPSSKKGSNTLAAKKGKKKSLSGRQRQKLAVRELAQLKAVQTHSSFQGDPFAAIQKHLQNTVVQANQELLNKTNAAAAKRVGGANRMDVEA